MAGIVAPNVNNLSVGKGFLTFQPNGAASAYHLGNCPKFTVTPKITPLPHFSAMAGTKVQDFSIVQQRAGEVTIDMEEQTVNNLALYFQGDIDATNPDAVVVDIMSKKSLIIGRLKFYGTNDVGPRWNCDILQVQFNPTSPYNPISDAYNAMTVTGLMLVQNGAWGTWTKLPPVSQIPPQNITAPFIDGALKEGDNPPFAKVGEPLTAQAGGWVGITTVAYQWNRNGHPISGATDVTYIPVGGDTGEVLTVTITATNPNGSTSVLSGPTLAVHA